MTEHVGEWSIEQINEAKSMRKAGVKLKTIARHYGVAPTTLKCKIDLEYAERRKERNNANRRIYGPGSGIKDMDRTISEDVAARLAEIPRDTRDLTARLMGDPLPGRRAIDRRVAA